MGISEWSRWCKNSHISNLNRPFSPSLLQNTSRTRTTLVVKHAHWTIPLVVGHPGPEGAVHGDLQVVGAEPVAVCIWVGEETTLDKEDDTRHGHTTGQTSCQFLIEKCAGPHSCCFNLIRRIKADLKCGFNNPFDYWEMRQERMCVVPAASCRGSPQCLVACCWGRRPAAPPLQSSWLGSCWVPAFPQESKGILCGTKPERESPISWKKGQK